MYSCITDTFISIILPTFICAYILKSDFYPTLFVTKSWGVYRSIGDEEFFNRIHWTTRALQQCISSILFMHPSGTVEDD
jgi:hypothetical protein